MIEEDFLELEDIFRKIIRKLPGQWKKHTKLGFSRSEVLVLYKLHRDGQQRASELARVLSITTGGLTGITDKLVDGGYIERNRTDQDRRVVYLTITENGQEILRNLYVTRKAFMERLFAGISKEELAMFKTTATKLLANFENNDMKE
ncbi:MarR family transcriptional regulator [Virgibacillus dakarensis]|uniref:MarR family transcriptional regulator n=1 Tax=Lentibacillus populi TaxID=1827502 RepID=A0A9W5TXT8_9BACI|nr:MULTISPECIES: MarR family transcriptional regulator [Bacillaceae]MBT2218271.1 MarR family transcriptional regulator [Virgibacillus dakarensis]MTW84472.1 MarR family transcriptional regulator [Virgibacillus dakarensis]GGB42663.1 MarR family transcriptional regulator [Lentibacillus populi]